jgi:hypothetical protein
MIITGLGIGVTLSLFTIVVQNAFPPEPLGQVTAGVQFFRSMGGTSGVAVLGTVMANRFQDELTARMPAGLAQVLLPGAGSLSDPRVLLSPAATAALQHRFAALGPQGQVLFDQFLGALRASLAGATTDVFAVGFMLMVLGLIATLFLPEIPLRRRSALGPREAMVAGSATDAAEARALAAAVGDRRDQEETTP